MSLTVFLRNVVGLVASVLTVGRLPPARRDERGLSQSAEIAILVGGVVALAGAILLVVRPYVLAKLPK